MADVGVTSESTGGAPLPPAACWPSKPRPHFWLYYLFPASMPCPDNPTFTTRSPPHRDPGGRPRAQGPASVTFRVQDRGQTVELAAKAGQNLFHALKDAGVRINGACDGHMGCGTCHVYLDEKSFKAIRGEQSERELDVLDYVFGLKPTSRLACGITVSPALQGATITIPRMDRNVLSEDDLMGK